MSTQDPMAQERLDAIRERLDARTGTTWATYGDGTHEVYDATEYNDGERGEVVAAVIDKLSDAVFIAHAPDDLADLLVEVERLRALLTVDEDMVERGVRESYGPKAWQEMCDSEDDYDIALVFTYRDEMRDIINAALNLGGRHE